MTAPARGFGLVPEHPDGRVSVISVFGEVDLSAAPDFEEELARAVDQSLGGGLVIDLSGVTFIDSTGLNALVHALERQRLAGGTLALVCVDSRVKMMLEVTRLDQVLACHPTREEAVAALQSAG